MHSAQVCADRYLKAMEVALPSKTYAAWAVKLDIEAAEKSYEIFDLVEGWRKDLFPRIYQWTVKTETRRPKSW